jgi:histone H3
MARSKQTGETPAKSKKVRHGKGAAAKEANTAKKRRFRPGTVALREIRRYQKSTEMLMRRAAFQRVVRDRIQEVGGEMRIQGRAMDALQCYMEHFIVELFSHANEAAIHAKRVTVQQRDVRFARRHH